MTDLDSLVINSDQLDGLSREQQRLLDVFCDLDGPFDFAAAEAGLRAPQEGASNKLKNAYKGALDGRLFELLGYAFLTDHPLFRNALVTSPAQTEDLLAAARAQSPLVHHYRADGLIIQGNELVHVVEYKLKLRPETHLHQPALIAAFLSELSSPAGGPFCDALADQLSLTELRAASTSVLYVAGEYYRRLNNHHLAKLRELLGEQVDFLLAPFDTHDVKMIRQALLEHLAATA